MKRAFALAFVLLTCCSTARADGGRLRFSKPAGPFVLTLFTAPEPLTPGPADFSVMVQDAASGEVLSNATILMTWTGPHGEVAEAHATRGAATNRLLEAAEVNLPAPGAWHLRISVEQGARAALCQADVSVEPGSRKAALAWTFALLPVAAVLLFVLHQRQKSALTVHRHPVI